MFCGFLVSVSWRVRLMLFFGMCDGLVILMSYMFW